MATELPPRLIEIATHCREIIVQAEDDGLVIDDGNVIDLLADNITTCSLFDLRCALAISGFGSRFTETIRRVD